jgi:hypothetical protein
MKNSIEFLTAAFRCLCWQEVLRINEAGAVKSAFPCCERGSQDGKYVCWCYSGCKYLPVHLPPRNGKFCDPVAPPHAGVAAPLSCGCKTACTFSPK